MAEIPLDLILVEILPKLPVKALTRFKCVCKVFKKKISSKKFIKHYFRKHVSTNPNHLLILLAESSNCLYIYDLDSPETFLRRLEIIDPCWTININDDYKLVHVSEFPKPSDNFSVEKRVAKVYSFRDDSCRLVNYNSSRHLVIEYSFTKNQTALFFCGSLHWVFFTLPEFKGTIRCFDITTETWGDDLYLPYSYYNNNNSCLVFREIGQLDGCLSSTFENDYDTYDIWIMKKYGVTESWIKLYSVVLSSVPSLHVSPVGYHRASTHVLLCESNRSCTKIVSYDTSCASVVDVEAMFSNAPWRPFCTLNRACICTGSLANIPRRAVMIGLVVDAISDVVGYWVKHNINEPHVFCMLTYCTGAWPGGNPDILEVATVALPTGVFNQAMQWMAVAHSKAYDYIHERRLISCKCN